MDNILGYESAAEVTSDFAEYVSPGRVGVYKQLGFHSIPGRRDGVILYDTDGHAFINCRSGEIFNLGHRPPAIVEALKNALDTIDAGDHTLISAYRAALAKRLAEITPGDIQYSVFSASGAEAIDLAIKLARATTGRAGVISATEGFHGLTGLALSAAGDQDYRTPFGPLAPGFQQVPFGDISALEHAISPDTAAVLLEPIPVPGGVLIPPADYFPAVRRLCDEHGVVLILDEVQTGLGRTGRLWAIDEWGVVPDILVIGKGFGAGVYPIAATCFRPHLNDILVKSPFIHTSSYGGSELGCVVGLATLEQTTAPGFLENVQERSQQLISGLKLLKDQAGGLITDVRGRGLTIGVEVPRDELGYALAQCLARHGVLAVPASSRSSTLIIKPPLIVNEGHVSRILEASGLALQDLLKLIASR